MQTTALVVGAGPIGLEVAHALKQAGIDYLHVEAGPIGHTMTWWAPGTRWFSSNQRISICGVPLLTPDQSKATREQYLVYLRQVVLSLGLEVCTYEPVADIERQEKGFLVTTTPRSGRRTIQCERLILATGGTDYPRSLNVEGEDLPHVDGYLRDPHIYFGRRVLIVGGRNSAVEAALRCHHAGAKVMLSYRGEMLDEKSIKYWLLPEINGLIRSGCIHAHFNTVPMRITPTHVTLRDSDAAADIEVEVDHVLKLIGYEQDKRLLRRAGVDLDGVEQSPHYDPLTMETNVPGLYIAGTAVGGTQLRFRVFLENCHDHGWRIAQHILGRSPAKEPEPVAAGILEPET